MISAPALDNTTRIPLFIEPLDTLFFRDGRPFGVADRGRSELPTPATLAGMIRSWLCEAAGVDRCELHDLRQNPHHPGHWITRVAAAGPWLAERPDDPQAAPELFFSVPAHYYMRDGRSAGLLAPIQADIPRWLSPSQHYAHMRPIIRIGPDADSKPAPPHPFIAGRALHALVKGQAPDPGLGVRAADLFVHEPRVGIGIDPDTGTTGHGQAAGLIYSAEHLRLRERRRRRPEAPGGRLGFYCELGVERPPHNGPPSDPEPDYGITVQHELERLVPVGGAAVLPFGGEGRRVRVTRLDAPFAWPQAAPEIPDRESGGFAVILLSPAVFGHHPRNGRQTWEPPDHGCLTGAMLGKPQPISGWDGKHGRPRPTRWAVPAGSVYFWRVGRNGNPDAAKNLPPVTQLFDRPLDSGHGWGVGLTVPWRWADA